MTKNELKYRAFISYSHEDTSWARWLHRQIERFPLHDLAGRATKRGFVPKHLSPVFRDRNDFTAGHLLSAQTLDALDASEALIILCSRRSAKSFYVNEEIRMFKWRHPNRLLVPVISDGHPGTPEHECFPPALKFKITLDGEITTELEPDILAADIREDGDGRDLALSKVVASLIGVPTDEVYRRAERDRRARTRKRNIVIFALVTLTFVAAYLQWLSNERGQILFDTAAACESYLPKGNASTDRINPLEKCIKSLEAMRRGAATDPRDAKILELISGGNKEEAERLQIEAAKDDEFAGIARTKKAAERYRIIASTSGLADEKKAREYYSKATNLDPGNLEGLFDHGYSEMRAANYEVAELALKKVSLQVVPERDGRILLWTRLSLAKIREEFHRDFAGSMQDYSSIINDIYSGKFKEVSNYNIDVAVSEAYTEIGEMLIVAEKPDAALLNFLKAEEGIRRYLSSSPNLLEANRDLAVIFRRKGSALQALKRMPEALKSFEDSLQILTKLLIKYPSHRQLEKDLASNISSIGNIFSDMQQYETALEMHKKAEKIWMSIFDHDSSNIMTLIALAEHYAGLGVARIGLLDRNGIIQSLKKRRELAIKIINLSSGDGKYKVNSHYIKILSQTEEIMKKLRIPLND